MFISVPIEHIQTNCIFFKEKKDNIIIQNGYFIPIQYITDTIVINTLFISLQFHDLKCTSQYYCKKYTLLTEGNKEIIDMLVKIEYDILNRFHTTKTRVYTIRNQMYAKEFKVFPSKEHDSSMCDYVEQSTTLFLRISGIWENENNIGLIYKLLEDYSTLDIK